MAPTETECKNPEDYSEDREFEHVDRSLSWLGARTYCEVIGKELAFPRNACENEALAEFAKPGKNIWLGIRDGYEYWEDGASHVPWHTPPRNYRKRLI